MTYFIFSLLYTLIFIGIFEFSIRNEIKNKIFKFDIMNIFEYNCYIGCLIRYGILPFLLPNNNNFSTIVLLFPMLIGIIILIKEKTNIYTYFISLLLILISSVGILINTR